MVHRGLLQITIFAAVFLFLLLNLSHAPSFLVRLFPEGPSTCKTALRFECGKCIPQSLPKSSLDDVQHHSENWFFDPEKDARNYGLTSQQCDVAFPGLFTDVNESVRRRRGKHITQDELERAVWPKATIRAMIYDGELYTLGYTRPTIRGTRHLATLHSLHRAMIASPTPLPNIEFALSVDDFANDPDDLIWSYTRKAAHNNTWLMPDFGFWGWPGSKDAMGSWGQVRRRMQEVEEDVGAFALKTPKIFWRGNVKVARRLRQDLIDQTKDKPWADVKAITWKTEDALDGDLVPIEDHCKYMFIAHTEGNSYSARLKYVQNCRSVIFAHQLQWIQPFEYLMVSEGEKQNYVEVKRDFSDLQEKMQFYLDRRDEAERVANNNVATFRDRYLTPAAEACYWRKLIRGWSEVSFKPQFYVNMTDGARQWRGTPFENFALMRRQDFLREESII